MHSPSAISLLLTASHYPHREDGSLRIHVANTEYWLQPQFQPTSPLVMLRSHVRKKGPAVHRVEHPSTSLNTASNCSTMRLRWEGGGGRGRKGWGGGGGRGRKGWGGGEREKGLGGGGGGGRLLGEWECATSGFWVYKWLYNRLCYLTIVHAGLYQFGLV